MLVVLMVLIMTTATATFAIHSTSMEIRSAGHTRQALQAEHLAEGGIHAAASYIELLQPSGSLVQTLRTEVAADVASTPTEATIGHETNLLRIEMADFERFAGTHAPPIETELARTPSLGPHNAYIPDFRVDGTDPHLITRAVPGRDLSGGGARYYRVTLTSRSQLAPPGDLMDMSNDDRRSYNEVAMRARAIADVGPFWIGGH